jgi:phage FluMu protein gp41
VWSRFRDGLLLEAMECFAVSCREVTKYDILHAAS